MEVVAFELVVVLATELVVVPLPTHCVADRILAADSKPDRVQLTIENRNTDWRASCWQPYWRGYESGVHLARCSDLAETSLAAGEGGVQPTEN